MTEPISKPTTTDPSIAEATSDTASATSASNGAFSLPERVELPDYILAQIRDFDYLPSSDELIFDDDMPMESPRHRLQMELLIETLNLHWAGRHDFYVGGNMFVYFSPNQVKREHFRGPDFFVMLGVDDHERQGWVVWEEGGKAPDVVIEMLSVSTGKTDKNVKKDVYLTKLGGPEYFWYDPFGGELAGFVKQGEDYFPLEPDERGRLISRALGLALARWEGEYQRVTCSWLRWETLDGRLLPAKDEVAEQERERANQAEERARQEQERAEQAEAQAKQEQERAELLAAKLRELGIDPESLK
ncbi:MAG: Uma2 family endonuclease [Blastocatellia bacterium]